MRSKHALDGLGDLDGSEGAAHLDIGWFVARIDRTGLPGQLLERPHGESGQHPTEHGRGRDGEQQMMITRRARFVGVGDVQS